MKTLNLAFLLSLILVQLSCGTKEDAPAPATNASMGVVKAQIDGQSFTSSQVASTYDKVSKDLTLVGYNDVHMAGFTLEKFSAPGTFALVDISKTGSTGSYTDVKTNTTYSIKEGRSGTVTVSKFDGSTIEGTFSMKTYNTQQKREVVVSSGTFTAKVETL